MLRAADFRTQARDALRGNWGIAILTSFVAALLGGNGGSMSSGGSSASNESVQNAVNTALHSDYSALFMTIAGVSAIMIIVTFIIGGAVSIGYSRFNLKLIDGRRAEFRDLFSSFDRIGTGICLTVLLAVYVLLWTLLLIIPGVIAVFSYMMAPYILAENPQMTANQAIKASKQLMKGNKWRLFCLFFSFIGWDLLCIITLGIASFWIMPYKEASVAAFYREISGKENVIFE